MGKRRATRATFRSTALVLLAVGIGVCLAASLPVACAGQQVEASISTDPHPVSAGDEVFHLKVTVQNNTENALENTQVSMVFLPSPFNVLYEPEIENISAGDSETFVFLMSSSNPTPGETYDVVVNVGYRIGENAENFPVEGGIVIAEGEEPPVGESAEVVLWNYDYDGENLEIWLKNVGGKGATVLLSLRDSDGVLIGDPFYHNFSIPAGGTRASTFRLPSDFSTVKIVFKYAGQQGQETIYLGEPPATVTGPEVSISTPNPSLQAELGGTTSYQIILTNEGGRGYVEFVVRELPESIGAAFYDGSQRVPGVTLEEGGSRTLSLRLSLPTSATDFEIGEAIGFDVFALDENQVAEYENDVPLDNLEAQSLELFLTPEGVPELGLSLDNVFARVKSGEELHITATVANTGTLVAEDVELGVTGLPYGWSAFANPDTISSIDPGEEVEVEVTVVLPEDASPGRYEFSVSASSGGQEASKGFEVRVEGASGSPILWILAIMFALVVVAVIMVKFRRR